MFSGDMDPRGAVDFAHAAQQAGEDQRDVGPDFILKSEHDLAEQFTGNDLVPQRTERRACAAVVTRPGVEAVHGFQASR